VFDEMSRPGLGLYPPIPGEEDIVEPSSNDDGDGVEEGNGDGTPLEVSGVLLDLLNIVTCPSGYSLTSQQFL
jgi:hypothetical protein